MNRADLESMAQREQQRQQAFRCRILCCASTPCLSSGGTAVFDAINKAVADGKLDADVQAVATGCMGPCSRGPMVTVQEQGKPDVIYQQVTPETAGAIIAAHAAPAANAEPHDKSLAEHVLPPDIPFFAKQQKVVLANSGLIDPEKLEDYVARGGYMALGYALREMTPEDVCKEMIASGLRGRGGAGFPAGLKWDMVRKEKADKKYVIANGDEGDPGAYMDRTLMESDPHRVLEGMAIAGYAVGADQGFIYVRGEYPVAAKRLERAIRSAERRGLLGSRVLDSGFNFRVDVRIGAGAFVCGEETALMASVMGRRGQPTTRPPYPAQSGLWGKPTLINNVETFGNVAPIVNHGAAWFAGIGTAKSKGTKIFALAGKVMTTGLIEVPMGITLREIVYDIGGGIPDDLEFKAAQTGGPSGGCIPATHLDTPVDYDSLPRPWLDHGLGRPDHHGRAILHGGRRQVLHGILHGRELRQMCALPRGHRPDAPAAAKDHRGQRHDGRPRPAAGTVHDGQGDEPLRPRPVRAQPGAKHDPLLPGRIHRPHS